MEDLRRTCFFCAEKIEGKKTLEHIIPNSLLGKLGIKEESVTGQTEIQYSRVKVPAHSTCNNEFGSKYESIILNLLEDLDSLYDAINVEEAGIPIMYNPDDSPAAVITTWLSKIYYGLYYYDLMTTSDDNWKNICLSMVTSKNFKFVRSSYKHGHGFQLPSSLYVFKTKNSKTDLMTIVEPSTFMMKIGTLTFVLCICDGYLTKNYLNGESLNQLKSHIKAQDEMNTDFPSHKLALAEIIALRMCIPKKPTFISSNEQIINMSLSTMVAEPNEYYQINNEKLQMARVETLQHLDIKLGK